MAERKVSRTVVVEATPEEVFGLLADPRRHQEIDGSEMIRGTLSGPDRLSTGAKFGMRMQMGPLPYVIRNTVVEFEEGRRIAWRHGGRHVWRYELEPVDGGARTRVTETFDWGPSLIPRALELLGYPKKNAGAIEQTLERLQQRFTTVS